MVPRSFAIDPATGNEETIGEGIWRPLVDPTGTLVVYWRGTLAFDAGSQSWQPAQGDLYLAPWSSIAPADLVPPSPSPSPSDSGSPGEAGSGSPLGSGVFIPATPYGDASPYAAGSSPALQSAAASGSGSGSASDLGSLTPSPSPLAPELLSPDAPPAGQGPTSWDARWDATGTHLAIWVGDPVDPAVGRLSLLTIDPVAARVDAGLALLTATPALPGFSLELERLAWVTPPGQDGQGSQLQVLAWSGNTAGTIESLPIPGTEQLVVAR